jgi:hypothetical protein
MVQEHPLLISQTLNHQPANTVLGSNFHTHYLDGLLVSYHN